MAITDSTTTDATPIEITEKLGPYCKHDLQSYVSYQDAALWELIEARALLETIATKCDDDDVALMAIVDKIRAAEHYSSAAWALREQDAQSERASLLARLPHRTRSATRAA